MPRRLRSPFWKTLPRRIGASVTLCSYLIATIGIPVPQVRGTPSGTAFPCQGHGCGCQTEAQCWQSCCCYTPDQVWAWAREQGIEPPREARKPTGNGWRTTRLRDRDENPKPDKKPCCQSSAPETETVSSCCSTPAPKKSCCQTDSNETSSEEPSDEGLGLGWVMGLSALKCQGQTMLWASLGAAVPVGLPLTWNPQFPGVGWLSDLSEIPLMLDYCPPSPPPRLPVG